MHDGSVFFWQCNGGCASAYCKKEFVPVTAKPGDVVTINFTITNAGSAPAYDAKVLDNLPPNLINPTGTALRSGFTLTITGQQVLFSGGTVPANGSVVLTIKATAHVPCRNIQNPATLADASTLPGNEAGERKYPIISSAAALNIQCVCVKPSQVPALSNGTMVGWWTFDEANGPLTADIAGFPQNGTHIGGVTPTTVPNGLVSRALDFSGNGHVKVNNYGQFNFNTSNFTVDAWVRTTQATGRTPIVDKRVNNNPNGKGYRRALNYMQVAYDCAARNDYEAASLTDDAAAIIQSFDYDNGLRLLTSDFTRRFGRRITAKIRLPRIELHNLFLYDSLIQIFVRH